MLCTTSAFAQTKKFRWGTDACLFESSYDAKKYTKRQLEDTTKLFHLDFFPHTINPAPFNFEEIEQLNVATLDEEYAMRTANLKALKIVKSAYWRTVRQAQLNELKQVYQLSRATILSYNTSTALRDFEFPGVCVEKYAIPLAAGGEDLLSAWRTMYVEIIKNHSRPDIVGKEFDEQYNSPERFQFARVQVTAFGWWNCVNSKIKRQSDDGSKEKEFKKLFSRTKIIDCETHND